MSRTTLLRTSKARAVLAAAALAGSFLAVGSASASTGTISRITTQKAPLHVATVVGVVGANLSENINFVTFTSGSTVCGSDRVQVVSTRQVYVKTPTAGCAEGVQVVKLYQGASSPTAGSPGTLAATGPSTPGSTVTFGVPPVLSPSAPVVPSVGSILGGVAATATVTVALPATSSVQVFVGGRSASGKVSSTDRTKILFNVPAGKPGPASLKVVANGFSSAVVDSSFTYKSAIKVSPDNWVFGKAAPVVRVSGLNFKPAVTSPAVNRTPTVTFCGVPGTVVSSGRQAYTDKLIHVTPPAWGTAGLVAAGVHATDGGVCTVKVSVDEDGTGDGTSTVDSVVTVGSSFTYAAY